MKRHMTWAVILALAVASTGTGCGMVRDFRINRHLKKGDQYFADGKYKEATIEYRNVLHWDPQNLAVVKQLGLAYWEAGQIGEAFPLLRRYNEQDPDDLDVRQKLGTIYLLGRAPDKAREQAEAILAKKPHDVDALGLLAEAAQTPEEISAAIQRIQGDRDALGPPDRVSRILGVLYARSNDIPRAEEELQSAVSANPDSVESHLALARLHLGKREVEAAEAEFKKASELSKPGAFAQLQLADFYLLTRRADESKKTLEQITAQAPDAFPAWLRLAEIAFAQGRYDDAQKALDPVLKANPDDESGLIIQTRIYVARKEADKAVETGQKAVKRHPNNALAHHALAVAQALAGNTALALTSAKDAVERQPLLADAVLLTGQLEMQTGDLVGAAAGLKAYLDKVSRDPRAWELLGRVQLRSNNPKAALDSFQHVEQLVPANPAGPYLTGLALRADGRNAEAKQQFERALAMAPGFTSPLAQLASMSFGAKNPDEALSRLERQAMLAPTSADVQYLLGRAYLAAGDRNAAEKAYLKAVELNPNAVAAYVSLGQLYGTSKEYDRAIAELDKALEAQPEQPAALMMRSIAQQMKGDETQARAGYEQLIAKYPKFAPANNNLAWILAEKNEDLQRAQLLAQAARDAAPEDPQIADTLGWVYYKQQAYPRAASLFREAAEKLPDNAEVQYHLGMALQQIAQKDEARAALEKSLKLNPDFPGAAEARQALAALGGQ